MFTADQYRAKALESAESLKRTIVPSEIHEFRRSKQSLSDLAQNEDWLADNFDKMIGSRDIVAQDDVARWRLDSKSVVKIEEHILRCLGACHHAMEHHPDEAFKIQRNHLMAKSTVEKHERFAPESEFALSVGVFA
jgi:hypothetical protein